MTAMRGDYGALGFELLHGQDRNKRRPEISCRNQAEAYPHRNTTEPAIVSLSTGRLTPGVTNY
jgi:hypothetical protein